MKGRREGMKDRDSSDNAQRVKDVVHMSRWKGICLATRLNRSSSLASTQGGKEKRRIGKKYRRNAEEKSKRRRKRGRGRLTNTWQGGEKRARQRTVLPRCFQRVYLSSRRSPQQ